MRRLAALAALSLAGCYSPIGELTATHVEPGGAVTASMDGSDNVTTTAIVNGSAQPITIQGTSPSLVFGIVFGKDDLTGMPASAQLLAGATVQMTVSSTGTTQLSVHLGGRSCAANTAVIHLVPDGKGHVDGDFTGTGDACQMSGTLAAIPIDQ